MPFPKLSAVFNNCALHALTPELCAEVKKYAENPDYDNKHNPEYLRLKAQFAKFYGFNKADFDWASFAKILGVYNPFDVQLILGPVLRGFMRKPMRHHEFTAMLAEIDELSVRDYIAGYTKTTVELNGRYRTLAPDEVALHVATPLGLSLCYHSSESEPQLLPAENPVAEVTIYHAGDLEGTASGHWERVPTTDNPEYIDYEHHETTQLTCILPFLGQGQELNELGLKLLRDQIQRVAYGHVGAEDIQLTSSQITNYLFFTQCVPKKLAVTLLGDGITDDTRKFIQGYRLQNPVRPGQIVEIYIKTFKFDKPRVDPAQEQIITRLLSGLSTKQINALRDSKYFTALGVQARAMVQRTTQAMKAIVVDFSESVDVEADKNQLLGVLNAHLRNSEHNLNAVGKSNSNYPQLQVIFDNKYRDIETAALARKRERLLIEMNFDDYLQSFTDQALAEDEKAATHPECEVTARALHTFVRDLTAAKQIFLDNHTTMERSKTVLKEACQAAHAAVSPHLEEHLDWIKRITEFLKDVLVYLGRGIGAPVHRWTMFNPAPERPLDGFEREVVNNPVLLAI
jgi:hypothetical protein